MWHKVWKSKRGPYWIVGWYDEVGRRHEKSVGPDTKFAEKVRRQMEQDLNSGLLKSTKSITLKAFLDEDMGLTFPGFSHWTQAGTASLCRRFLSFCGDRPLSTVSHQLFEEYRASRLSAGTAPATVNRDLRTLKGMFSRAVERNYLSRNPIAKVKVCAEQRRALRVLTVSEVASLIEACPDEQWRLMIALFLTTGLRRAEVQMLEWPDVDFQNNRITIQHKQGFRTKSGEPRTVAMVGDLSDRLLQWRQKQAGTRYVFTNARGAHFSAAMMSVFSAIVKRAGIAHCTIHDLRRTPSAYIPLKVAQKLLGHANVSTTQRNYAGFLPDEVRDAQESLPYLSVLGGQIGGTLEGVTTPPPEKPLRTGDGGVI